MFNADYNANKLPKGKSSTKGIGGSFPDPTGDVVYEGRSVLPAGKVIKSDKRTSLLYNEFIVYDVNQVELRYLFKIKA